MYQDQHQLYLDNRHKKLHFYVLWKSRIYNFEWYVTPYYFLLLVRYKQSVKEQELYETWPQLKYFLIIDIYLFKNMTENVATYMCFISIA